MKPNRRSLRSTLGAVRRALVQHAYPLRTWTHRISATERERLRHAADALATQPRFAIFVDCGAAKHGDIRRTIESIRRQIYSNWTLHIAVPANADAHLLRRLDDLAVHDSRLRIHQRSFTVNSVEPADFTMPLPPGAVLSEDALFRFAENICAHPDAGLLYADEDEVNVWGLHVHPNAKPAWSLHLLRSRDYIAGAFVVEARHFCTGDACTYDLLLRAAESLPAQRIVHISHVLLHAPPQKNPPNAQHRALEDHLARLGRSATVECVRQHPPCFHIAYDVPADCRVSVIIPTKDRLALLRTAVDGILHHTDYPDIELIIVDNGSVESATLDYFNQLRSHSNVHTLRVDGPFNFSVLCNAGVRAASGAVLCFLNNDVEITQPGWLRELTGVALQPEVGAAGPLLTYPDGRVQHMGIRVGDGFPTLIGDGARIEKLRSGTQLLERRDVSALTGACLVMRRDAFDAAGGFDEALAVAYNDVDLCLSLRAAGYDIVWTPFAQMIHVLSASRGFHRTDLDRARHEREWNHLRAKWGSMFRN